MLPVFFIYIPGKIRGTGTGKVPVAGMLTLLTFAVNLDHFLIRENVSLTLLRQGFSLQA